MPQLYNLLGLGASTAPLMEMEKESAAVSAPSTPAAKPKPAKPKPKPAAPKPTAPKPTPPKNITPYNAPGALFRRAK
jgi:hypothetical protein